MMHWQKLNKLPIAPPSSTTSQFLVEVSDSTCFELDKSRLRHEWDNSRSRVRMVEPASCSFRRYQAISRGNRGNGIVKARSGQPTGHLRAESTNLRGRARGR